MKIAVENRFNYVQEVRREPNLSGAPLHSAPAEQDVAELVDETFTRGLLAERLPLEPDTLEIHIEPTWLQEPIASSVEITLAARVNGSALRYTQQYRVGRWYRAAQQQTLCLREEGTLSQDETAYSLLLALRAEQPTPLKLGPFQTPQIVAQSLDDCGVAALGAGNLLADRPVLVNRQFAADVVRRCLEADTNETGGAVLGKIVRLDQPLPGTSTRIVTVVSASVDDRRHVGETHRFSFDPTALAAAAQIAQLRGLGETVQTVYHTHGWKKSCGNCNQHAECPLAESIPSLLDYQLIESLFPSKTTLMPIAGRKLGAPGRRPVLQIHGWRGGQLQPLTWQEYSD
jgi:hypothetical protein